MGDVQNEPSDGDIIREIMEGNINAFQLLMDRYQGYVAGIAVKHVPRDSIEEVAHQTFIRAYRSLKTFKAKTPFKYWLAKIAVHCCCDFWRAHYRNRETPISSLEEDGREWVQDLLVDGSVEPFGDPDRSRLAVSVLRWAMERLPAEDRMVLTLVHLEEYTTAEAARLLRWSVPKVKIRAHRARKKLRKALLEVLPEG